MGLEQQVWSLSDGKRLREVKAPSEKQIEDVFSTGMRVASAPSSWAIKTKKSWNMLKTGIGRGQLSFASDNPSAYPNACPRISSFYNPIPQSPQTPAHPC